MNDVKLARSFLNRLDVSLKWIEPFEGNKYLVRESSSPNAKPRFFLKRPRDVDPLSRYAIEAKSHIFRTQDIARNSDIDGDNLAVLESVALLPHDHDEVSGYLVYRFCSDATTLKFLLQSKDRDNSRLLRRVGQAIRQFHEVASCLLQSDEVEHVDIHDLWPELLHPSPSEYALGVGSDYPAILRYLSAYSGLRQGIDRFSRRDYLPEICHADFKFDNVLVEGESEDPKIIDFNDLIKYDRNFDLGVACSEIISSWLFSIDYEHADSIEAAITEADDRFRECRKLIEIFLAGYSSKSSDLNIAQDRVSYFAGRSLINAALGGLHLSNHLSRFHWACLHVGANIVSNFEEFGALFQEGGSEND